MLTYNTADITLSSFIGKVNANMSAYANWLSDRDPFIYGNLGLGIRMRHGFTLRPQSQIDITNSAITSVKAELEKRISRQGYLSLMGEENFRSDYRSINLSFRWDFSFAQVNLSTRISNHEIASTQGAQGSFAFGSGNGYVHADNRSSIGRSGVAVLPFVDINHNGIRDEGEPVADGVSIRMNGGRIIKETSDSIIRITGLEPYTSYVLNLDDKGLNQISYRIEHKSVRVYVDPNQFKKIDIPVKPMGEVNGYVFLKDETGTNGQGRILISIFTKWGEKVTTFMTERDGSFTYLGLSPGDYYARVDSVQIARLNWGVVSEFIKFQIEPDLYGDIIYDLEFMLHKPDKGPEGNLPVKQENSMAQNTKPDSISARETVEANPQPQAGEDTESSLGQNIREGNYLIQFGAFKNYRNAGVMAEKLDSIFSYPVSIVLENGLHKVRTKNDMNQMEAEKQKEVLQSKGWKCVLVATD
jgi:hypothetical protein